jgi:protein SOK2
MSDPRGGPNGNAAHDAYQGPGAVSQYSTQGYPPSNGVNNSGKRGRDDEEQDPYRPDSVQGDDMGGLKRRKTMEGGAVGGNYADPNPGIQRAHTMTAQAQRARR